jgi:hypothetical protein
MTPPPVRGSKVATPPRELRWAQTWLLVEETHAPSFIGWTKMTRSTLPSSSPEFGVPSGPSLSYRPKFTSESALTTASVRPARSALNAAVLHTPLQLPVGDGHPVVGPTYRDSLLSSVTQPTAFPCTEKRPFDISS